MISIKSLLAFTFLFFLMFSLVAQTTDLARLEYLQVPFTKGKQSVERFRGFVQLPIPIKEDYLIIGLDYRYMALEINESAPFDTEKLESAQNIQGTIGYVYNLPDTKWRLAVNTGVRIASNLETSLVKDDFIYVAAAYAIYVNKGEDRIKPYRWILGLFYSSTPGRNYPLPLVNYYQEPNENWTYTLGVPKSNLRYKFDDKNHVQVFATLDNFFANIQENIQVPNSNNLGENISMTNVALGAGYEHYFTEHLLYYVYAGHTVYNEYRIRNNDREDAYVIEDKNSFYLRTGLKFKI